MYDESCKCGWDAEEGVEDCREGVVQGQDCRGEEMKCRVERMNEGDEMSSRQPCTW